MTNMTRPEQLPGLHERRVEAMATRLKSLARVYLRMGDLADYVWQDIAGDIIAADPATALLAECAGVLKSSRGWLVTCSESKQASKDLARLDALLSRLDGGS